MFDHGSLPKKQRTSIERLQNQTNRYVIEDVLFQVPEEIKENPPSVSTATPKPPIIWIRQVDKAIDNTLTMKATRTQYRISHSKPE